MSNKIAQYRSSQMKRQSDLHHLNDRNVVMTLIHKQQLQTIYNALQIDNEEFKLTFQSRIAFFVTRSSVIVEVQFAIDSASNKLLLVDQQQIISQIENCFFMTHVINFLKIDLLKLILLLDLSIHDQMSCLVECLSVLFDIKMLSAVDQNCQRSAQSESYECNVTSI